MTGGWWTVFAGDGLEVMGHSLSADPDELEKLARALSADERERAARYRWESDRRKFVVGRGWLRQLLGLQLGIAADEIRFCYGTNGKPELDGDRRLSFNLSHAEDLMLVVICQGYDVGVDVERLRPSPEMADLASEFLTRPELDRLALVDEPERLVTMYRMWTRKEAWLKARGVGLSVPLECLDVEFPRDGCWTLGAAGEWDSGFVGGLHDLKPAPGYVGAVAAIAALCQAPPVGTPDVCDRL
jgi:4'-phosphopantetheinyl transferase